ncbi:MAG TPA: hypothetical protein VET69_12970 [Terriglobales bacterium]|jgi:hypothetical protein|nr:hypothetical protein [Terriglobales bacterium]
MLAKCANPICSAPFRYLHEGKLFRLDLGAGPPSADARIPHRLEYFWLCDGCARTMTLEMHAGKVLARPLPARTAARALASAA